MHEPLYVVSVWNCRAAVCRRRDLPDGSWTYEPATNWEALEPEAVEAAEAQASAPAPFVRSDGGPGGPGPRGM